MTSDEMSLLFAVKAYHCYGQYRAFHTHFFHSLDRSLSVKSSQSLPIIRSYQAFCIPFVPTWLYAQCSFHQCTIALSRARTILGTIGKM